MSRVPASPDSVSDAVAVAESVTAADSGRQLASSEVPGYTVPMHEMGIAMEIYRTCRETVSEHGDGRLERVRIAVGELSAVEPDLIAFGWEAVIADTPDEGATLDIEWCRADQRCPSCGEAKDRSEGTWLRICPDCGSPLEVRGGDELDVLEVSFEIDDDPDDASNTQD